MKPSTAQREILERLAAGAVLWETFGLYGFPVVECRGGFTRIKTRDFKTLIEGGWVVVSDSEPFGGPCSLTDAGRAALAPSTSSGQAARTTGQGEGAP